MTMTTRSSMEMVDLMPSVPSRQQTLESQRQRRPKPRMLEWLLNEFNSFRPSGPLDDDIVAGAKAYRHDSDWFLRDFSHMKRRPNARVHEIFDIFIRSQHTPLDNGGTTGEEEGTTLANNASMQDWLDSVKLKLNGAGETSFVLCCFAAENAKSNSTIVYNVFKPWPFQNRRRLEVPRGVLLFLVAMCNWHISKETAMTITHARKPPDLTIHIQLPSTSQTKSFDLDESAAEFSLSINWQHKFAKYQQDLNTYIWESYGSPPPFSYAHLFISRKDTSCAPRALILFSTKESLRMFRQRCDLTSGLFSQIQPPAIGLLHTIYAMYGVALIETKEFLHDISQQIFDLTFQSRRYPSKQKFQYLLFLNDCKTRTESDMVNNLKVIDDCSNILHKIVPVDNDTEEARLMHKSMSELRRDTIYIRKELKVVGRSIEKLRAEVESQINLQSRNTLVVTILAAIYVPLAFVTSFLGMNVTEGSAKHWLHSTTNSTSTTTNQSNSNQQFWDLRWFALLSVPLLFGTIILPLITGPTIRYLCQSYVKLRVYWRLGGAMLAVAYLTSIAVSLREEIRPLHSFLPFLFGVIGLMCNMILTLLVLYHVYDAWHSKRRLWVWIFFEICLIVCLWLLLLGSLN